MSLLFNVLSRFVIDFFFFQKKKKYLVICNLNRDFTYITLKTSHLFYFFIFLKNHSEKNLWWPQRWREVFEIETRTPRPPPNSPWWRAGRLARQQKWGETGFAGGDWARPSLVSLRGTWTWALRWGQGVGFHWQSSAIVIRTNSGLWTWHPKYNIRSDSWTQGREGEPPVFYSLWACFVPAGH